MEILVSQIIMNGKISDMQYLKRNKNIALILGIVLLLFYIYNRIYPIHLDSLEQIVTGKILNIIIYFVIRFISAILCINIAKRLNSNQIFWGLFGFILPPISLIAIYFIKVKDKKTIENNNHEKKS